MARTARPTTQTTLAIGYVRVSTDQQADRGISLEAQQAKLVAYGQLYDLALVDVVIDAGVSAKTLDRPGLQRTLGMLRTGQANALLVAKLDRLTRSVKDLGSLVEEYFSSDTITLLSVADSIDTRTAAGRLVLNMLGSVAQWERETIGERTSEALAHSARPADRRDTLRLQTRRQWENAGRQRSRTGLAGGDPRGPQARPVAACGRHRPDPARLHHS